jgi:hypothetical protein
VWGFYPVTFTPVHFALNILLGTVLEFTAYTGYGHVEFRSKGAYLGVKSVRNSWLTYHRFSPFVILAIDIKNVFSNLFHHYVATITK